MCCQKTKAFTLIEMLVVIGIIVMAMLLAIPAIRSMTGSRSIAAAENAVSTAVSTARSEAMARQKKCGILFYLDTAADKVGCALIQESEDHDRDTTDTTDPTSVTLTYLDLIPDRDPILLPAGIRLRTMKDAAPKQSAFTDFAPGQFLGFNELTQANTAQQPSGSWQYLLGGVVLFDREGHLVSKPCGFRLTIPQLIYFDKFYKPIITPAHISQLGLMVYGAAAQATTPPSWPNTPGNATGVPYYPSSIGVVLYDREAFAGQSGPTGTQFSDWDNANNQPNQDAWLNNNCTPVFINRYDGSIMRAE